MNKILGFASPFIIYGLIYVLHILLPGRWVTGYITSPGTEERLKYRLNGLVVFITVLTLYFVACYSAVISWDWLYTVRWYSLAGACFIGLVFSLVVVLPFSAVKRSFLADIYLGRAENLQLQNGRVDAKMWLYLAGATMLGLNVVSFAAHHLIMYGPEHSAGLLISATLLLFFLTEYMIFEEVHLYTYDLFAERVGFKLGWGCIVFYAYFYAVFLWSTVELPDPQTPSWLLIIYVVMFLSGWLFSRGANLQKYYFKKYPGRSFLGIMPESITDGKRSLLVNGFWGLSRHVNYLGEILMSTGIILCTGYPKLVWPWLYPLYYVLLLFTRQADDDKRCRSKYGELWDEYRKRVPYKIIPFIY